MKRVTRAQAKMWLQPLRRTFQGMRAGFAPAARGYAVMDLRDNKGPVRVDYCIASMRGLISRVCPETNTSALERIEKRLANGVLVSQQDLDQAMRELRAAEDALTRIPVERLHSAVLTEQIAIEIGARDE